MSGLYAFHEFNECSELYAFREFNGCSKFCVEFSSTHFTLMFFSFIKRVYFHWSKTVKQYIDLMKQTDESYCGLMKTLSLKSPKRENPVHTKECHDSSSKDKIKNEVFSQYVVKDDTNQGGATSSHTNLIPSVNSNFANKCST